MRFRDFAASSFIASGLMLAPAVYAANPGDPLTPAITVPGAYTLAGNPAGEFMVSWQSGKNTFSAQAFASSGNALSAPFPVVEDGGAPMLAMDSAGGFTAAWKGSTLRNQVSAQRFALTGGALTPQTVVSNLDNDLFLINGGCNLDDVGTSARGEFVVAWDCGGPNSLIPSQLRLLPLSPCTAASSRMDSRSFRRVPPTMISSMG
jgi:hypothetical protein